MAYLIQIICLCLLAIGSIAEPVPPHLELLVRDCADVLIEKGRDRYGEVHSPLFVCVLDPETLEAPHDLPIQDGLIRTEGRIHRRNIGGADLWEDQSLIRVLDALSARYKDPKYRNAADEYIRYFLEHCRKPDTGLLTWGSHIYWDVHLDRPGGDGDGRGPHEPLLREAFWERMWKVSPERVRDQIERMWEWHVCNKETGQHNRHDDAQPGCDFSFMGSTLIGAFAFLYQKTSDPVWDDRAKLVMRYHWNARNKETNLAPDAPALTDRYDGLFNFTTLPGPHASILLRTYESTRDTEYLEIALGHLRAFDKYAWDESNGSYWGMLRLDGVPEQESEADLNRIRDINAYDDFRPIGHVDVWRTVLYSYEFPVIAAQSYAYAAELTGASDMKRATARWARVIEKELPAHTGRRWRENLAAALVDLPERGGTYAENYGRAISFFLMASRVLERPDLLQTARELAVDAITRLHHPKSGLFVGHAAKGVYEATDGVGYLLYALLELEAFPEKMEPNF